MKRTHLLFIALMTNVLTLFAQSEYTLDKQFSGDGYWLSDAAGQDRAYDGAIQPDGKIVTVGFSTLQGQTRGQVTRLAPNGTPDAGFGGASGTVYFQVNNQPTVGYVVALQPDGSVVVAGTTAGNRVFIARLLPGGGLDPAFGTGGSVVLPQDLPAIGGKEDETPMGMALQPDGKILVGFRSLPSGGATRVTTVVRLLPNGSLDAAFGSSGAAQIDVVPSGNDVVSGLQVAGGLVYISGYGSFSGTIKFTLCCLKPDGSPNAAFGTNGVAVGPNGVCSDLRVQASGRIVAAGYTANGPRQILVTRYLPNGTMDASFGSNGTFTATYSPIAISGMALRADGGILLAGYHSSIAPFSFFITGLSADGDLNFSFSGGGAYFQEKINGSDEELHNIAVGPKGEIVAVGYYRTGATGEDQAVLRLTDATVRLVVGKVEGAQGDTVLIPVRLEGCDKVFAMQGNILVSNPAVAQVVGFKTVADVSFNGTLFNYFNANGKDLSTNDTLFFVKIALTGSPGDSTPVTITAPAGSVIEVVCGSFSLTPHLVVEGQAKILAGYTVSGTILDRLGKPVGQAIVTLEGKDKNGVDFLLSEVTGATGTYTFKNVPHGSNFTVKPAKDINPKNGITSFDLLVGQRWLLGFKPPEFNSGQQVIAGDANNNKLFSSNDLLIIQSVFLEKITAFPNNTSWVFHTAGHVLPAAFTVSNVFPYPADTALIGAKKDAVINFTGIKVGDIVTSADPQNKPAGEGFDIPTLQLVADPARDGDNLLLTLRVERFEQLGSVQFGLQFDASALTYLSADAPGWGVGDKSAAEGTLRFSWFSPDGQPKTLPDGTLLLTLRFRPVASGLSLSKPLVALSEATLEAEAMAVVSSDFERRPIALRHSAHTSSAHDAADESGFRLYQSAPNPTSGLAYISFDLPEATLAVSLEIFDALGRSVQRTEAAFEQGRQQVEVDLSSLTSGVYRYQLRAGRFVAARSLVVTH